MNDSKNKAENGSLIRYFTIMIARTIGFVLILGFIVTLLTTGLTYAKAFLGKGEFPVNVNNSSQYNKGSAAKKDPTEDARVRIQGEYAVDNPNNYIVEIDATADISSSVAAGNILRLTQDKNIRSFAELKEFSANAGISEVKDALGKNVWVKKADGNEVLIIGTVNGVQCTLDLSTHETKGCVVP